MDDVLILSDSSSKFDEDEIIKSDKNICNILKVNDSIELDSSDSEISKVNYDFYGENNLGSENINEKEWSDSDFPEINFEHKDNLRNNTSDKSENNSNNKLENDYNDNLALYIRNLKAKYGIDIEKSSDDNEELLQTNEKYNKKKEKKNVNQLKKKISNEEKKKKQEICQKNKIDKQEEIARQKAMKQLDSKNRLKFDPEHSVKLMEIIFDEEIKNYDFFIDCLKHAQENNLKYKIQSQPIPKCISWNRYIEDNYINEKYEICTNLQTTNENHILIIWNCEETVKRIFDNSFISAITDIKLLVPDKKLLLIIYKMENYFKYLKNIKEQSMQEEILGSLSNKKVKKIKRALNKSFINYPTISRKKFEKCLVEIQLMYNVSSRLIEDQAEIILCLHQYTKSLALLPSKIDKRLKSSKIDWYINCDNRDTVKVDKDGNGLKRLWQQQLCQFTLMSLETSEAILSVYKTPSDLMEAYKNCNQIEGEMLLKDIPIRRAAGPLTSVRKIGPELSKKLYIMFTSDDGEINLNN